MMGKDIAKQWSEGVKALQSDQSNVCNFCQKPPTNGGTLKRCAKCKPIGRTVHYCSRFVLYYSSSLVASISSGTFAGIVKRLTGNEDEMAEPTSKFVENLYRTHW
jgi:hypothetical protein